MAQNRNKLDNRKENLRIVTPSQNNMNSKISARNTSGVKGISWAKEDNLWHTYININNKRYKIYMISKLNT